jgi:predicted mannosyl-3-phosphoglycerate phosphatase (HAD superfamily)
MGIAFIASKAEKFKHQRDAAFEEQMASENIFSDLPDTVQPTYRCKSVTDDLPEIGTPLLLYRSKGKVDVFYMNKKIGQMMSPDSSEVGEIMVRQKTAALAGRVVELRPISRIFLVQLQRPTPGAK